MPTISFKVTPKRKKEIDRLWSECKGFFDSKEDFYSGLFFTGNQYYGEVHKEDAEAISKELRILNFMEGGFLYTASDIADELEESIPDIQEALKEMEEELYWVTKLTRGDWLEPRYVRHPVVDTRGVWL